ncbi:MAG: PEP-CTERM sorting domain-containing protein [Pseudomonadota bacterium]
MKIKYYIGIFVLFIMCTSGAAFAGPYAPAAGVAGSTAIHMDDAGFLSWVTGYENYLPGTNVDASWQTPEKALGKAVGDSYDIVCLGRGGSITLTFSDGIGNGDGYDFAVFENSFSNNFLELGYVEVSSNGTDFFRFDNDSLTASPVAGFGSVDPTNIDGLAGKYRQGYGTPFDLAELAGISELLDANSIGWVRIIDIVGDGSYFDTASNVIYDPYPTVGSAGFDLDAIGVFNAAAPVPIPGAVFLLGSGLVGLVSLKRKKR